MQTTHIRIDPAYPLCWEDTETLRFGFDKAQLRLHAPSPAEQRFIGKLCDGVKEHELAVLGARCELDPTAQQRLMQALSGLLVRYLSPSHALVAPQPRDFRVVVLGAGTFADRVRESLVRAGFDLAEPATKASFAIVIERFFGAASRAWPLQSEEVPHYPISLSDTALSAGPLVLPGNPPCLSCVELHRLDAQPYLAVLAAQIIEQCPAAETAECAELAGALAVAAASFYLAQSSVPAGDPIAQAGPALPGAANVPGGALAAPSTTAISGAPAVPGAANAPGGAPACPADPAAPAASAVERSSARLRFALHLGTPTLSPEVEVVAPHPQCGCVTLAQTIVPAQRAA